MEIISMEIALIVLVSLVLLLNIFFLIGRKKSADSEYLLRGQAELAGRLTQLSENSVLHQKIIDEKLMAVSKSVGEGLMHTTNKTAETLHDLRERLAKIDVAQQKISSLSEQVVSLQEVLSNKQARGAFGEIQLNDLVKNALPPSAYEFQVVLPNQKRADCVLRLPNPPGLIVIDSKFPLESYNALRSAQNDREKIEADRFFKGSVLKHIKDISEKYIIPGITAESALMFLPSEAVYAELHANFVDVVESSYRSKVWIVSPTTLMATLNTVRAVLKDARMREAAGIIQKEVGVLIEDISRLDKRVESLDRHFSQAGQDISDIKISSDKISKRINKIEDIELEGGEKLIPIETKNVDL